ncbi:MAG: flagellar motor stator protein MotA [Candidatus Kapabacteria bacterium]|nr:flagellar motor stator protein MotA [Ignavibacteriota bacterium]MCW5885966.1 flagellar motor stator protein MotA [Candidatus Kapabacteria bacterium]
MFVIVGFIVVFVCVFGGFFWASGFNMDAVGFFLHPYEYIIIGGAAIGSMLISNPMHLNQQIIKGILGTLKGSKITKAAYVDLLKMLYELFQFAKREGLIALEQHIENPKDSSILSKYQSFLDNPHAVEFLCDTLKVVLSGGVPAHELEELMDIDLENIKAEAHHAPAALNTVSDALPGLGIVAAVLGIIITMLVITEGAATVGAKVGGALVGTFMGVLLAYGFVGPLSRNMEGLAHAEGKYLEVIKAALLAFSKSMPPTVAVEYGRRSIDPHNRPSFAETEEAIKNN